MNTFIEEVQHFLIAEFEKRGVYNHWQLQKTHPKIAIHFEKLCGFPEDLTTKDIKTMLNWLEIEKIEFKNIKITWKKI